jgi:hypothetical protein
MKAMRSVFQSNQVLKREFGRARVIQFNVGNSANLIVARNRYYWQREICCRVSTANNPSTERERSSLGYSSIKSGRWRWLATK